MNDGNPPMNIMQPPPILLNPTGVLEPPELSGIPPEALLQPPVYGGAPGTQGWATSEDFEGQNLALQGMALMPGEQPLPSLLSLKVDPPDQLIEGNGTTEVVLPQVIEQVLALKNRRALELGTEENAAVSGEVVASTPVWERDENEAPESENIPKASKDVAKTTKNKKKKKRKKNKKLQNGEVASSGTTKDIPDLDVEYIQESLGLHELAPQYRQFFHIFEAFKIADTKPLIPPPQLATPTTLSNKTLPLLGDQFQEEMEEADEKIKEDKSKMSKRKLKKLTRLSVAELKQLVNRPDVVEMHDVTARDPKLLVQLKAHRNTVQVPRHWCFKRKYLQGKRGIEKPPFNLPDFIKRTGIMEMRASLQDKDETKTLKAKMRERARPKLGKIDIDYQKLHDAFFKWQTKPKMTIHGDLYYEGKEFETRLKEKKPGDLSEELRTALGMPVGPNAHKVPPPWLIAMQRYGPPPSYPNLKIPGLNAPIPDGCSFGYHAGGWGKPPVDETGKPLYGDVFGTHQANIDDVGEDINIDRSLWGELESESEEESEEEEEDDDKDKPGLTDETGLITPAEGLVTPSGLTSIPAGMETPEAIELRKKKIESEMEGGETPVLYHILPEKRNERLGAAMMASAHVYDMTGLGAPPPMTSKRGISSGDQREGMVELALDPSELDMDSDAMAVRYEQQMRENQSQLQKEDLSDMLAEHVAKQKNKRKRQQNLDTKQTKKYKEFKF
ncbi:hypothetical protein PPYR_10200 [Photinus pyralis]|uniref:PSP proline-rich domain-containing protein n=1 Tax=Photinus pyralis TaxID=7054 RepID=A0A1Y1NC19_PHOPY|nr:splicing factor 3B subunit 2 isoform X1 [Photinus pyralis]KAB0796139.1 hypothetical protein PPYR_10200 [Photinus pyralis]